MACERGAAGEVDDRGECRLPSGTSESSGAQATAAAIRASRKLERTSVMRGELEEGLGQGRVAAAGDPERERGDAGETGERDRDVERAADEGNRAAAAAADPANEQGEAAEEDEPDRVADPLDDDRGERPGAVGDEVAVEDAGGIAGVRESSVRRTRRRRAGRSRCRRRRRGGSNACVGLLSVVWSRIASTVGAADGRVVGCAADWRPTCRRNAIRRAVDDDWPVAAITLACVEIRRLLGRAAARRCRARARPCSHCKLAFVFTGHADERRRDAAQRGERRRADGAARLAATRAARCRVWLSPPRSSSTIWRRVGTAR